MRTTSTIALFSLSLCLVGLSLSRSALGADNSTASTSAVGSTDPSVFPHCGTPDPDVVIRANRERILEAAASLESHANADLTHDGFIDMNDLLLLLSNWGACPATAEVMCEGDLTGDYIVDDGDLMMLIRALYWAFDVTD